MKTSKTKILIIFLSIVVTFFIGCQPQNMKNDSKSQGSQTLMDKPKAQDSGNIKYGKPVIYLYPTSEQLVSVKLDYKGKLTCTYPEYNGEWKVKARPDGTLINIADNREYSYLYWEGISKDKWDMSQRFVVKGSDTVGFLKDF